MSHLENWPPLFHCMDPPMIRRIARAKMSRLSHLCQLGHGPNFTIIFINKTFTAHLMLWFKYVQQMAGYSTKAREWQSTLPYSLASLHPVFSGKEVTVCHLEGGSSLNSNTVSIFLWQAQKHAYRWRAHTIKMTSNHYHCGFLIHHQSVDHKPMIQWGERT